MRGLEPDIDLSILKDKVCFVGLTAEGSHDINPTPLEPVYPMVGSHANVFNSIIWGNDTAVSDDEFSQTSISYSSVEGGFSGDGNITDVPSFTNAGTMDFSLSPDASNGRLLEGGNPDILRELTLSEADVVPMGLIR